MRWTALLFILISESARCDQFVIDFSSRDLFESGTAVWNTSLGAVHPSLRVINYSISATPRPFDLGDGSHGAFVPSRYAEFSVGGDLSGNTIRLDTTTYRELNVTEFELAQNWVLEPVGTSPLVIKSLSDVKIRGSIWCHGGDGQPPTGAVGGAGGQARCGGHDGGRGGNSLQNGVSGLSRIAPVTGGTAGLYIPSATWAVGGGGGGSWNGTSNPGVGPGIDLVTPGTTGGSPGVATSDPDFLVDDGGAGGGGGAGSNTQGGGGGGAGGGIVRIFAGRDVEFGLSPGPVNYGLVLANGGSGASSASGGPGGGGGGGSVQIFAARNMLVRNNNADGAGQAYGGFGGVNGAASGGAVGGSGRNWYSLAGTYSGPGFYSPTEEFPNGSGDVRYNSVSESVITRIIDLQSTFPVIQSIQATPSSTDFSLRFKASNDNFQNDDTGWTTDLNQIQRRRYLKLEISITTSNTTNPTMLDAVTIQYDPYKVDTFDFAATCARTQRGSPLGLLFFMAPLVALVLARLRFTLEG